MGKSILSAGISLIVATISIVIVGTIATNNTLVGALDGTTKLVIGFFAVILAVVALASIVHDVDHDF